MLPKIFVTMVRRFKEKSKVGVFVLGPRRKWLGPLFPGSEMGSDIHRLPKMVSAAYPTSSRLSSSSPPRRLQSSDRCFDDRALVLLHAQLRGLSGIKVIFSCPR